MTLLYLCIAFLFGVVIGSFLNVCIYRIPRDLSVVAPRSFCPECGKQLSWRQNIPLLSYVLQRGRCRFCTKRIPARYPTVELTTGIVFLLIAMHDGLSPAALKWMLFSAILIVLFWTDLEERLLPDEFTLGGIAAGLILAWFIDVPSIFAELIWPDASWRWQSLLNAIAGAMILALPVWLTGVLWGRLRKREALGLGDVKLLALIGVFLGPGPALLALTLGAITGAVVGLVLALWQKRSLHSYEMPFGSFLCLAAIVVVIAGVPPAGLLDVL